MELIQLKSLAEMLALTFVIFFTAVIELKAAEINCEKFDHFDKYKRCCFLNATTTIGANTITMAGLENPDVDAILFQNNRNIQFLPVKVHKQFPNLETYLARNASVREISALNFERLINLKFLNLRANQIEFIPNYCFEGLIRLEEIFLGQSLSP